MFSFLSPEERVPAKHPLRPARSLVVEALRALSPVFDQMYVVFGRPSIAPEKLLRTSSDLGRPIDVPQVTAGPSLCQLLLGRNTKTRIPRSLCSAFATRRTAVKRRTYLPILEKTLLHTGLLVLPRTRRPRPVHPPRKIHNHQQ